MIEAKRRGFMQTSPRLRTIADVLAAHPWSGEHADARRLEWLWSIDVPAAPGQLWPLLADLSRLNRALKLPLMTFVERDGVRHGMARYTGVKHEWIELPWNWVAGRWYELSRIYAKGAMRALRAVIELEPTDTGTRVHVYFGVVPRSKIFDLGLKWSFGSMGRAYQRLLPQIGEELKRVEASVPACLDAPAPPLSQAAARRLDEVAAALAERGLPADIVQHLVSWIRNATDAQLERIRVRERARAWSVDEDELLRVCLHATRVGLLDLSWDVVCPHCRGVRNAAGALAGLPTSGQCEPCGITFGTDIAEAVEITFHVHPSIRPVDVGVYCSAEPAHKPHIHVQRAIPVGASVEVVAPTTPGKYRMRTRGEMKGAWLEIVDGAATRDWISAAWPNDLTLAPGATLKLVNEGEGPVTFILETAIWLELALRPGRLLSFQEFRDLFSEEYLGSGVQLAVGDQTILFTDVVGSTAMYAERGDPVAFVEVKKHFETVFDIIGKHRGAVVKTIGDAVMGAFNEPLDAVKAAHAIHKAFPPDRGPLAIRLRISVNSGTCIAVRLNAAIDYFGHAVNLAAKLQSLVEAWQIAMSDSTFNGPGVEAWIASQGATLEDVQITLKGVEAPIAAKRWTTTVPSE
jgi:class 3 adenylate cyclase